MTQTDSPAPKPFVRGATNWIVRAFGSFGLSVSIFFLLFVLTFLGTEAQQHIGLFRAQKQYFESYVVLVDLLSTSLGDDVFTLRLPLPGGLLLMYLLFANVLVGGMLRMRVRWRNFGVLVTHAGMLLLLVSGWWKQYFSDEGGLQLYEGDRSAQYVSYHDWELLVEEPLERQNVMSAGEVPVRQWVFLGDNFAAAASGELTLRDDEMPFDIVLSGWAEHAKVAPVGWRPVQPFEMQMYDVVAAGARVEGLQIYQCRPQNEEERNLAAVLATVKANGQVAGPRQSILWAAGRVGWLVEVDGRQFHLTLQRRHFDLPFTIHLDDFIHEYHPNTSMAREYQSQVTVFDGDEEVAARIRMNEPLRRDGMIVFQSSWGPTDGAPDRALYSGFSVVRNPADKWPEYSLYVITAGMVLHFIMKLMRYLSQQFGARA